MGKIYRQLNRQLNRQTNRHANRQIKVDKLLLAFVDTKLAGEINRCLVKYFNSWVTEVAKYHAIKTGPDSPAPDFLHNLIELCLELPRQQIQLSYEASYRQICSQLAESVLKEWCERYVLAQSHQYHDSQSIRSVKQYLVEDGEMFNELFETYQYIEQEIGESLVTTETEKGKAGANIIPITSHMNSIFIKKHQFKKLFMECLESDLSSITEEIEAIRCAHGDLDVSEFFSLAQFKDVMMFVKAQ